MYTNFNTLVEQPQASLSFQNKCLRVPQSTLQAIMISFSVVCDDSLCLPTRSTSQKGPKSALEMDPPIPRTRLSPCRWIMFENLRKSSCRTTDSTSRSEFFKLNRTTQVNRPICEANSQPSCSGLIAQFVPDPYLNNGRKSVAS